MNTITISQLNDLAHAIAVANLDADKAALGAGEALTADRPVAYLTGAASIEDDIRAEWCDESEETIAEAIAESDYVLTQVMAHYAK